MIFDTTDHLPTFLVIKNISWLDTKLVEIRFRDKSSVNIGKFVIECSNWNFVSSSDNVNLNTEVFIKTIDDIYCRCFPLKIKSVSSKRLTKP